SYNPEGDRTLLYTLTGDLNAIGYSTTDNLLWGYNRTTDQIFKLGSDGVIERYTIPNLTYSFAHKFNIGTVDEDGYFYLYEKNSTTFYTIDIDESRPTYLQLVDPTNAYVEKVSAPWGTATSS